MTDAPAPAPAISAVPSQETPWYGNLTDPELKGYVDNKNWKTPVDALKSYKQLETMVGVPPELRINLPKDPKAPGAMDPIYNKLGRPEKPEGYSFELEPENADAELADWARKQFHAAGLTQEQAATNYKAIKGLMTEALATEAKEAEIAKQAGIDALKKEWGSTFDANAKIATEAIDKLGLSAETVAKLRDLVGHADIAKMFHAIGSKVTEAPFVSGQTEASAKPAITVEGARAQRAQLLEDREFVKKVNSGDVVANARITELAKIIAGAR